MNCICKIKFFLKKGSIHGAKLYQWENSVQCNFTKELELLHYTILTMRDTLVVWRWKTRWNRRVMNQWIDDQSDGVESGSIRSNMSIGGKSSMKRSGMTESSASSFAATWGPKHDVVSRGSDAVAEDSHPLPNTSRKLESSILGMNSSWCRAKCCGVEWKGRRCECGSMNNDFSWGVQFNWNGLLT